MQPFGSLQPGDWLPNWRSDDVCGARVSHNGRVKTFYSRQHPMTMLFRPIARNQASCPCPFCAGSCRDSSAPLSSSSSPTCAHSGCMSPPTEISTHSMICWKMTPTSELEPNEFGMAASSGLVCGSSLRGRLSPQKMEPFRSAAELEKNFKRQNCIITLLASRKKIIFFF